jgi:hypothetical protein
MEKIKNFIKIFGSNYFFYYYGILRLILESKWKKVILGLLHHGIENLSVCIIARLDYVTTIAQEHTAYFKIKEFFLNLFLFFRFKFIPFVGCLNMSLCIENTDSPLPNSNGNIIVIVVCLLLLSISIFTNLNSNNKNNKPIDLDNINLGKEEEFPKLILKNDVLVPKVDTNFIDSFSGGGIINQILIAIAFSLAIGSSFYFICKKLKNYKIFYTHK